MTEDSTMYEKNSKRKAKEERELSLQDVFASRDQEAQQKDKNENSLDLDDALKLAPFRAPCPELSKRSAQRMSLYDSSATHAMSEKSNKSSMFDSASKNLALAPSIYFPGANDQEEPSNYRYSNSNMEGRRVRVTELIRESVEVGAIYVGPQQELEAYYTNSEQESLPLTTGEQDEETDLGGDTNHDSGGGINQIQYAAVETVAARVDCSNDKTEADSGSTNKKFSIATILLLVVALAIGLGVGLTRSRKSATTPSHTPPSQTPSASPTESYRPTISGTQWGQLGQDLDGLSEFDIFGQWVALSGDGETLAVASGTSGKDNDLAYVRTYRLQENMWMLVGGDLFQDIAAIVALSFDGSRMIVARGSVEIGVPGFVQAYEWNSVSELWLDLGPPMVSGTLWFGSYGSISADGSVVAVSDFEIGTEVEDETSGNVVGHFHLFRWNQEQDSWLPLGRSIDVEVPQVFGVASVSLNFDGSIVAISAAEADGRAGFARVYEIAAETDDQAMLWIHRGSVLTHSSGDAVIGAFVSISHDGMVVAASQSEVAADGSTIGIGKVLVFDFVSSSSEWIQRGDTLKGRTLDGIGDSLSISGDGSVVAFGAPERATRGFDPGFVRVVHWARGSWVELGPRLEAEEVQGSAFGVSISLSAAGRRLAVGDIGNDASGELAGSVRVFELLAT